MVYLKKQSYGMPPHLCDMSSRATGVHDAKEADATHQNTDRMIFRETPLPVDDLNVTIVTFSDTRVP